jgi:hypothetical protein
MLLKHNFLLFSIFFKSKTKWGSGFGHFPIYITEDSRSAYPLSRAASVTCAYAQHEYTERKMDVEPLILSLVLGVGQLHGMAALPPHPGQNRTSGAHWTEGQMVPRAGTDVWDKRYLVPAGNWFPAHPARSLVTSPTELSDVVRGLK